jgi:hypothetical protein
LGRPDSSVSIVTRLQAGLPRNNGLIPFTGRIFLSSERQDPLWGPHSLLLNGTSGLFSGGKSADFGPGSSLGIATELPGWTVRDRIPVRTRFSARPDRP